jgi:hypothetical protein
MISFGKYKNKSYNYVLQNDIKYCNWILTQSTSHKGMNEFINFLKINKNIIIPKGSINCSSLSLYYNDNNDFLNLINDLQIKNITLNLKINDILLPEDIKGIYFDYLIRYKICYEINKEFNDVRCLCFINGHHPYFNINNIDKLPLKIKNNIKNYKYIYNFNDDEFNDNLYYILKEIVELSYNNMKNFTATNNDIFNVSLCHSLYFNNIKAYEYFDFFFNNNIINDNDNNLQNYIKNKINDKNKNVLCNPILGNHELQIGADADLIIDKELIDIKCSKYNIGENINDFIQLIIYICLYFIQTGIKCEKITIFNPILSYEKYIDLTNWNNFEKIIDILKNRII